ncbi:MAG: hypothetical protein A2418_03385 [Candidatus Brennerbacteria bacterium RIFOXYC1_FULL_41_11]|uniref:Uncharacterized protein n=1 Tax=Candidatus Brennerbacteria bacterium RIFOXYD1_FULL_41_16 TaxID=1797529 RepID=A0A1G1XL44_9BACT|nr:MAG: hypothetical protein A2391_01065 [Candidatus Brennerbacteria bacterium RIFOXYB1_FULL_41_13]OGY40117.1 MAG: hypothetical protein A2418_03385 [Candidatus Brennerbacteria bacterium RIFOXYC1_FULL_41_11]OGY40681.1 MAG: hypothetical protein A2570_00930 [Candidatus Brennerbacteria bacterium RIFOXYD1_FULL_41_16]
MATDVLQKTVFVLAKRKRTDDDVMVAEDNELEEDEESADEEEDLDLDVEGLDEVEDEFNKEKEDAVDRLIGNEE